MGTEPIEQEVGERWENYVQRSARFCAETMTKEQPAWNTHPGSAHLPLSLCLTAIPKTSSLRWHGAPARREQRKASLPIALSFDQLQFGHMPFHHAVSDPPAEPGSHRLFVFLDSCDKGLEFWDSPLVHLGEPTIEALSQALPEHLGELLDQVIGQIDFGMELAKHEQGLLLFSTPFFRSTKKKESRLSCKHRRARKLIRSVGILPS